MTYMASDIFVNIGLANGKVLNKHQALLRTNANLLTDELLGMKFNEIWIKIQTFLLKHMSLKMLSAKWQPFCSSLSVL